MIKLDDNTKAFFALVRAGLWGHYELQDTGFKLQGDLDWEEVYRLASEQSVLGLVLVGIESLPNEQRPPKVQLLQWIGEIQMLKQQNQAMNNFIGKLVEDMRKEGIYTLLVKGQGVAQCYEKPLWRSCGDVDFLLSSDNYEKAKETLSAMASHVDTENAVKKHLGMTIDSWIVELHGTMHTELSRKINRGIDEVQDNLFYSGNVRSWMNDSTVVFLPNPDNDIIIIFTHFLDHFCFGGIGLRQICDLCRLLWVYKDEIDHKLLHKRLEEMGLMTEWKVFASLMVNWLGMPKDAMPFYSDSAMYKRKASRASTRILRSGNLGVNVDNSYRMHQPKWKANLITFRHRAGEFFGLIALFPLDAPRFFCNYLMQKVK